MDTDTGIPDNDLSREHFRHTLAGKISAGFAHARDTVFGPAAGEISPDQIEYLVNACSNASDIEYLTCLMFYDYGVEFDELFDIEVDDYDIKH